jgi:hypothetical protein
MIKTNDPKLKALTEEKELFQDSDFEDSEHP